MAYRDEVGVVLRENEEIRKAIARARADARFTALRQVLLAFAFGLSWSVLGDSASAGDERAYCVPPPMGHGWLNVRPNQGSTFVIDERIEGIASTRIALSPGTHRVRFAGVYGKHCSTVHVSDGRSAWAYEDDYERSCE